MELLWRASIDRTILEGLAVAEVSNDRAMTEEFVMVGIGKNNYAS